MQGQGNMQKAMQQSEEEFRKQFDRDAPQFHKGDPTAVPIGGSKIPQSMASMYPEGFDPNQPQQVIDYGQGYKKIEADRSIYQNLKKSLAKLCPIVEAFMRHDVIFKQKGDPTNQKHVKAHEQNISKQKENLQKIQVQLQAYIAQLQQIDAEGAQMAKDLTKILDQSNKKYDNKQALTDFNFKVKKVSAKSFAQAQKCLQKLKDIKKNYKAPESKTQEKVENKQ